MLKFSILASLFFLAIGLGVSQNNQLPSFYESSSKVLSEYVDGGLVDYAGLKSSGALTPIVDQIAKIDFENLSPVDREAYLINAYNLLVIDQIVENYPISSVVDISNFFDGKRVTVAGKKISLNTLEKEYLFKKYGDPRLHFVLVCGALDCPPIIDEPYLPSTLEAQLDRQTKLALDNEAFLRTSSTGLGLSQIFNWYATDFGGNKKATLEFINMFKSIAVDLNSKISYYDYNWTVNEQNTKSTNKRTGQLILEGAGSRTSSESSSANAFRYVVSSTVAKGTSEFKIFNNLYSQDAAGERASFNTTSLSALYGLTDRINVGLAGRYRRVRYDETGQANNLAVLGAPGANSIFRQGITGIGPRIRIAPFKKLSNFSIESQYLISTQDDASGGRDGQRFIDFDGDTWITQFFNDFSLGNRFSLFTEIDFIIEDIGKVEEGRMNRTSTPFTSILSFFPNPKTTFYALGSYSPFWQTDFDYFTQIGAGAKYQFTSKLELEFLATSFSNSFISDVGGSATTVNLGLRFNL